LCKRDNKKYRNYFEIDKDRQTVTIFHWNSTQQKESQFLLDYDFWFKYSEQYFTVQLGYVSTFYEGKYHRVHRMVLGLNPQFDPNKERDIVDHLNGNTYDNRLENIRIASFKENAKNKGFFNNK